ncbi:EpsG family protein [Polynucleobacter rarus]|uniref:EpsG family protein n=1 Tax=Polynucleobacter rarus TaxID=556055 RepID=UPI00131F2730|nr:EpsG family protein [Polynucleobacter rarus]
MIPALYALGDVKKNFQLRKVTSWDINWYFIITVISLMVGFRYQVGGDWDSYLDKLESVSFGFKEALLESGDPGYNLINWLSLFFGGIFVVNFVCGLIFTLGLVLFCRTLPFPWLAITVAIPYLVIVVSMGYSRQAVAIGISMMALASLNQRKLQQNIIYSSIAVLFHSSAIIMLPFYALSIKTKRWILLPILAVLGLLIYQFLIASKVDSFTEGYLYSFYSSSGAKIRVWMNAVPSILFLIFRNKFPISNSEKQFWTLMALGGILTIFVLQVSTSSTAVDRVALYWIPIQLYVFSWLPLVLRKNLDPKITTYFIVIYYAIIQFVWLFYADTAFAWLPYQFYFFGVW